MPWLDRLVAEILAPLAVWIFLSGLDDLILDICFLRVWFRARRRHPTRLFERSQPGAAAPRQRKAALMIPCWQEHEVIGRMLEYSLSTLEYENYDIWLGLYPNDPLTIESVSACEKKWPRVRHVVCPNQGPTTKADCLNAVFDGIRRYEQAAGQRYEIILQQDAEDMAPALALRTANENLEEYEMVQFPVLPLPTRPWRLTHGSYCDEFAEFHLKELFVRSELRGFVPSAGVGTAYRRDVLDRVADLNHGELFDAQSLTEDYSMGLQLHRLGASQLFVRPLKVREAVEGSLGHSSRVPGSLLRSATRAYFPLHFGKAVRQRTRWVTGIVLQSWQRFGWDVAGSQIYWLWRDRKGLISHPVSLLANVLFTYGLLTWTWSQWAGSRWHLRALFTEPMFIWLLAANAALLAWRLAVRAAFGYRVYGLIHALLTPLRAPWSNLINFCASVEALRTFLQAKLFRQPLRWRKTTHSYPDDGVLTAHRRRLGEILLSMGQVSADDLDHALAEAPQGQRIGEYLIQNGVLKDVAVQKALGLQQGVSFQKVEPSDVQRQALQTVPRTTAAHLRVIPFRVDETKRLWLASPEPPSESLRNTIARYSPLSQGFVLITPSNFETLLQTLEVQPTADAVYRAAGD